MILCASQTKEWVEKKGEKDHAEGKHGSTLEKAGYIENKNKGDNNVDKRYEEQKKPPGRTAADSEPADNIENWYKYSPAGLSCLGVNSPVADKIH